MKHVNNEINTRCLILIDIENLVGTPHPSASQIADVQELIEVSGSIGKNAQCVVACSHFAAQEVMFSFPNALKRIKSGINGADLALLGELSDYRVMSRFQRIVLCSGDGVFTEEVARLGSAGTEVTVIAREGSLSKRLELAAKNVVTFNYEINEEPEIALMEAC